MGPSGHAVGQRAGGYCVSLASVRLFILKRPEHVEYAAWLLLFSSYAAVVMERSELASNPHCRMPYGEGTAKLATAPPVGANGTRMPGTPCCFRLAPPGFSPWGRNTAWDRNTWVKRTARLGVCPSQRPIGESRARSS